MVTRAIMPLAAGVCAVVPVTVQAQATDEKPPELLRARGMLAITGLIILGIMMIVLLRLYTHAIRRRWKKAEGGSRMSPSQWQARRWRETWHKTKGQNEGEK
jgi:hypothetical protein